MIYAKSLAQRLAYVPLLVVGLVLGQSREAGADDPPAGTYRIDISATKNEDGSITVSLEITANGGPVAEDTYLDVSSWITPPEGFRIEGSTTFLIPAGKETTSGTVSLTPITEEDPEDPPDPPELPDPPDPPDPPELRGKTQKIRTLPPKMTHQKDSQNH